MLYKVIVTVFKYMYIYMCHNVLKLQQLKLNWGVHLAKMG